MTNLNEVRVSIKALIKHHDCVAWQEFGDRGNPCYSPYGFSSSNEMIEDARTFSAVKQVMQKGSDIHCSLSKVIAEDIGAKWVSYDWLLKIVSRVLAGSTYEEIHSMLKLSSAVKAGMKKRGLTTISKIEEAFA